MAVYKSTHCYPFLNTVDIRVSKTSASSTYPAQYLKCKVDTSNKTVTGYKIRILDNDNNQIFPPTDGKETISPVYELRTDEMSDIYKDNGTNSGINGTYLQIPFFQTMDNKKLLSYNAIYYKPQFSVDHVILTQNLATKAGITSIAHSDNITNWVKDSTTGVLSYIWPEYSMVSVSSGQTIVETTYPIYGTDDAVYYTDNAEEYNLNSYDFDKRKNRIRVNGEVLNSGQIVLVASDSALDASKTGFYTVQRLVDDSGENAIYSTILVPLTEWNKVLDEVNNGQLWINVKKGDPYHNVNVKFNGSIYDIDLTTSMWACYKINITDNNIVLQDLPAFNVDGSTYKWEITLYQGDIEFNGDHSADEPTPYVGNYNNINAKDIDMVINSGNILGSNSSRIQIASGSAFSGNIPNPNSIIPGLKEGVLVLQSKYMAMGFLSSPSVKITGNRVYVQTYDATYGHVYPMSGNITSNMVNNCNYVQFYKYSNNPDEILNTDIVQYGTGDNVGSSKLGFALIYNQDTVAGTGNYTHYNTEAELKADPNYSIVNTYIEVNSTDKPFSLMSDGDKILLAGQNDAKQNGVYTYNHITCYNGSTKQNVAYLTRAASYKKWSSYIGKIIYCENYFTNDYTTNNSLNIESLANAGSFQLWNPMSTESGDSDLYFTEEIPVLLFETKIKAGRTYNLYCTSNEVPSSTSEKIDGILPQSGDIMLLNTGHVYRAGSDGNWAAYDQDDKGNNMKPDISDYCSILSGKSYGKRIIQWGNANPAQITWTLHTALILKNTSQMTYIAPFTNVSSGMYINFKNNNKVYVVRDNNLISTSSIKVTGVNPRLFCISHNQLKTSAGAATFLDSEASSENNTPWKYDIKSYFKASDENPFYSYESPYLLLYKNNVEYSDLAALVEEQIFMIKPEDSLAYQEYMVNNLQDEQKHETNSSIFITGIYHDSTIITGRCVKLAAKYKQFEGLSWESYRWTLRSSTGELLQDTGKKYDKTIGTVFYGLSNDKNEEYVVYYATLYLTDNLGNTLEYIIQLNVATGDSNSLLAPFNASYECGLHAIKLSYQDSGILTPAYTSSGLDTPYVDGNSIFERDKGLKYYESNADSYVTITHKNEECGSLIYFDNGSEIQEKETGTKYADSISLPEKYGLNYFSIFNKSLEEHQNDGNYSILLNEDSTDLDNHGELYFETEFVLDNNFVSDIIEWKVQGDVEESCENPSAKVDGSTQNSNLGYLVFKLTMPNELNTSHTEVNQTRNKMQLNITSFTGASTKTALNTPYNIQNLNLYDLTYNGNNIKSLYYLQPSSLVNGQYSKTYNTGAYEYLRFDLGSQYIYLQKDIYGQYYIGGEYFLGNLCLSPTIGTSQCFTYWDETRPVLSYPQRPGVQLFLDSTMQVQKIQNTRTYQSSDGIQLWPSGESETKQQWLESSYNGDPTFINEVTANNSHVIKVQPMERHYTMSQNSYHMTCKIKDIQYLYKHLNIMSVYETFQDNIVTLGIGMNNETIYATITIQKTLIKEE